jgi:osmotically-inducible protein OsmY
MAREERRAAGKATRRRERVIPPEIARSQLLGEGDVPSGPAGEFAGGSGDFTSEGGRGTNTPDRYGGPLRRRDDPANDRNQGSGGDGGFGTLGGGTYYGEGDRDDAPRHGDWSRHATGGGSGALGHEGLVYEGEHTWGEGDAHREQAERRTDERIHEDLLEQLDHHAEIDATAIEVLVEEGEVTLQGVVPDRDMRRLAEGVAESVVGVSLVHNRLRLARP